MTNVAQLIQQNKGTIGAGVGGLAVGGVLGYLASRSSRKKSKSKRRNYNKNTRKRSSVHKRHGTTRGRYTPHTAGKKKDTSHRRIRQTKNGQPYIILASGKAKFISKKSAKMSRKRNGGRY